MEEAPVTAATGALGPVVAKLRALLQQRGDHEYRLRRRTRKDVRLIKSKLKSIHSILWVTWESVDLDDEGKELRMEAWRLADDMNDAIDDFILSLKRSNDGRRFMEEDKNKTQPSPFQHLKRRADDVSERCWNKWKKMETTFCSLFSSRTKSTIDDCGPCRRPRVVDPYVHKDISKLVGLEEPRDELIEHLIGEEESTPQLKMASILGAAGTGKTTLARLVYEAIEDKFQARAFVSITSCHNMKEVLISILQQVAAQSIPVPHAATRPAAATEKHLVVNISNFLKDKRYLVIIDDIWHCGEWETINKSLPDNNLRSRIVTTSRVKSIAEVWRGDFDALIHEINHNEFSMVGTMIAMNADVVGEGFDCGRIVYHCRGMPLAVACMISALAKERERREQQGLCVLGTPALQEEISKQVMGNGIQNTPGFESLVESLDLGYNDLPHHMLKTCLLYCSIYPEGHYFQRDDLVRRWIAEGFVCKEEAAEDYFDELVSRGWFQEIEEWLGEVARRKLPYAMQPMMRNYLRQKLREDNFITCTSDGVPSSSPIGRLCIDWPSSDAVDPLSRIDWHHIRSLVVHKEDERIPYKNLEHLRVLDVQYTLHNNQVLENRHLKDICGGMLRLRHLFVSSGLRDPDFVMGFQGRDGITEMPAEIARLQHLETLEVHGTGITRLPAEIGHLKKLKTLDVGRNHWHEELQLPREIGNLQQLETLSFSRSNIREQPWETIRTLKKLKTLDVSKNPELSGIPRDIGELRELKNLDVSENQGITELPKEIWKLQHLETLNLSGTRITELPCEIRNLQQLEALYLREVTTITKLPRDIGKLQHLETLDVRQTNVRKIPREIGGLKKLKILHVKIGILPFEAGQLPKLEGLPKCVHKAWKNSDLVSSLAGEILSFEKTGQIGDGGLIVSTKHMHIPQWIKDHFNDIGTLDIRICTLEEQDLKILREMPYLNDLSLRFEAVPRKPISIRGEGSQSSSSSLLTAECHGLPSRKELCRDWVGLRSSSSSTVAHQIQILLWVSSTSCASCLSGSNAVNGIEEKTRASAPRSTS